MWSGACFARATATLFFLLVHLHIIAGFGLPVAHCSPASGSAAAKTSIRSAAAAAAASMSTSTTATPAVDILPAKAPLPLLDDGITVVSFNVLLPNGNDGWWMYKSYQPHVPEEHRVWPFRKALMRDYLLSKDADVVCVQEASAETFESDFDFMKDAGYDCVLHSKFRFRSATFFKTSRLELACEKHKDRVLVTGLRTLAKKATAVTATRGPPSETAPPPPPPATETSVAAAGTAGTAATIEKEASTLERSAPGGNVSTDADGPVAATATGAGAREHKGGGGKADEAGVSSGQNGRLVMVVNCHLTGGAAPERRMRQVLDGLDAARKEAARVLSAQAAAAMPATPSNKSKGQSNGKKGGGKGRGGGGDVGPAPGTSVPVVVCGDFNSHGRTAVWELLTAGVVEASFREQGYPETAITSKVKRQGFGPFADVYEEAYEVGSREGTGGGGDGGGGFQGGSPSTGHPPPTFVVPLLHTHFLGDSGEGVSDRLKVALSEAFHSLVRRYGDTAASAGTGSDGSDDAPALVENAFLPREGVEAWLVTINRAPGRGSEFRAAEAIMGPVPGGGLTLEDFLSIYAKELRDGKFWGVAHDLHALEVEIPGGMPWVGPYTARFDRVFYSKATLEAVGAMEPLCQEERELVAGGDCLPNSWHPSDHLAVAGVFRFR